MFRINVKSSYTCLCNDKQKSSACHSTNQRPCQKNSNEIVFQTPKIAINISVSLFSSDMSFMLVFWLYFDGVSVAIVVAALNSTQNYNLPVTVTTS